MLTPKGRLCGWHRLVCSYSMQGSYPTFQSDHCLDLSSFYHEWSLLSFANGYLVVLWFCEKCFHGFWKLLPSFNVPLCPLPSVKLVFKQIILVLKVGVGVKVTCIHPGIRSRYSGVKWNDLVCNVYLFQLTLPEGDLNKLGSPVCISFYRVILERNRLQLKICYYNNFYFILYQWMHMHWLPFKITKWALAECVV